MTISRRSIIAALAVAIATLPAVDVRAQGTYPDRTIKLIIPFPPGGLFDTVGRPLADKLKAHLGTIIIENVGGAGSSRGAAMAARAAPDGYTLFLAGNGSHVVMPIAASKITYDPVKDFEPIALIGTAPLGVGMHPSQPFKSLADFIDAVKREPGKLSFGSAGTGSLSHLTGEMFKLRAKAPGIVHVPYTGGGPLSNDLVGGHIPVAMINLTSQFFELHAAGKMRILAVTTPSRLPLTPDIPAAVETIPGMISQNFAGLYATKGTPAPIIQRISAAVAKAMGDPELQRIYAAGGFSPSKDGSPEVMRKFLEDEITRWRPVIEASGFKVN
ncbi:MAG: tripartite tricarboxylate transporter substrate binding protein [Hyphomicrobiaceae bacterium]